MPKMKTNKSAAKRFKKTATGKLMRSSSSRGHLFTGKSRKRKRRLRGAHSVSSADFRRVRDALPN